MDACRSLDSVLAPQKPMHPMPFRPASLLCATVAAHRPQVVRLEYEAYEPMALKVHLGMQGGTA